VKRHPGGLLVSGCVLDRRGRAVHPLLPGGRGKYAGMVCAMTGCSHNKSRSPQVIRVELVSRLRAKRPEIEKAILARIQDLAESSDNLDPTYLVGIKNAVTAAVNYSLLAIQKSGDWAAPIPLEIAEQARRSARDGVGLDAVLRRYAAGNKSLEEFIVTEAEGIPSQVLCEILKDQGLQVDRFMESVSTEYTNEIQRASRSSAQRQTDRVLRLLKNSSSVRPEEFDYDFEGWHVCLILRGPNAEQGVRLASKRGSHRSLVAVRDAEYVWIWLGGPQPPTVVEVDQLVCDQLAHDIFVAIGEPRRGLDGWRRSHREAQIALQVGLYQPRRITRCRDVILIAAVIRDQSLAMSLIETYLVPLDQGRGSGLSLRKTLRAYFEADQNIASAAISLGISRNTAERHLRRVEETLGQPLPACNTQLQVALKAEELIASPRWIAQPDRV